MRTRVMMRRWCAVFLSCAFGLQAAVIEWGGSDGYYNDATNWVGGVVPDLNASGNTALISGGAVVYVPGGDLLIHNGSTLQVSGGSYTQTNGTSWMQMAGGNLVVDGGVFNQGTCNNIVRDSSSSISVSAGTVYLRDAGNDLSYNPAASGSFSLSGTGTVVVPDTFKPVEAFTMSAGTLIAEDISFAGTSGTITFSGGRIEVDADDSLGYNGIYSDNSATDYIDFTTNSSGVFFFQNYTLAELLADNMLGNGRIRYNGVTDSSAFEKIEVDGGVQISLLSETNTVPTGLVAKGGNGQVSLSWNSVSGASSYNVKRSLVSEGPYDLVVSTNAASATDSGVTNGTTYYYVVSAVMDGSEGDDSAEASATPLRPAPVGLVANAGNQQVSLVWGVSSGATGYNVKRSLVSGGPYAVLASPSGASYTDTDVTNGVPCFYVVSALDGTVEGEESSEVSATPGLTAPTGVTAAGGDLQVDLEWDAVSGATNYYVKRSLVTGGPYSVVLSTADTSAADSGLTNGTTYYYVVSAEGASGTSEDSDEVSAVPGLVAPTGLAVANGDGEVSLSWDAVGGALSYNVKRSETDGGPYAVVASPAGASTIDTGLTNGTVYYYVVSTVGPSGESADSDQVSGEPVGAAVIEWGGSDGEYTVGANWVGGVVPDLSSGGVIARIGSGNVTHTPTSDLQIHSGSTLQISGGSWTQTNATKWLQMSGGNLVVDGGTFNQGSCNSIVRDADSSITVSAGTATIRDTTDAFWYNPSALGNFVISGSGTVYISDTFRVAAEFAMTSGALVVEDISFAGTSGPITLSGGRIEVDATSGSYSGIYSDGSSDYINFTAGSTGVFCFQNYTLAELTADNMLGNGRIVVDGVTNAVAFNAVEVDGGVELSLADTGDVPIADEEYVIAGSFITGGTNLTLVVSNSVSTHLYQMLATDALTPADWQSEGAAQSGDGGTLTFDIAIDSSSVSRFFKIDVQQD